MDQSLRDFYIETYDEFSEQFPDRTVELTPTPQHRLEACVYYMKKYFRGGDILEFASDCGQAALSLERAQVPFNRYVASEFSDERCRTLRAGLPSGRFEVMSLDAEHPALPDDRKFDAIIMVALIEHLIDPMGSMERIRNLLKPGGFVLIDTPNIAKWTRRIKLAFGVFPATASLNEGLTRYDGLPVRLHDEGHLHYFTFRSLELLCERAGFKRFVRCPYVLGPKSTARVTHLAGTILPTVFSEACILAYGD
jgi:SAM-dependent methyltransferase